VCERITHRAAIEVVVLRFSHRVVSTESLADRRLWWDALANLPAQTLAMIDGPCHGLWLELALACDVRLAVATPDTWLSFAAGWLPGYQRQRLWERTSRRIARQLERGESVTAREAQAAGLIDDAVCARRAKIDLQQTCWRLRDRPRKPLARSGWRIWPMVPVPASHEDKPGLRGWPSECTDADTTQAVEVLLRGGRVLAREPDRVRANLSVRAVRGRATPLELEQAARRIEPLVTAHQHEVLIRPAYPQAVAQPVPS
jgi:enoyl-CoA hydratase/carnithine racemase